MGKKNRIINQSLIIVTSCVERKGVVVINAARDETINRKEMGYRTLRKGI